MSELQESEPRSIAYITVAVVIFSLVAFTFLFPCNFLIPLGTVTLDYGYAITCYFLLDRRTVAVVGALSVYLTRTYLFPSSHLDLLAAIDFNVLILLASIMIINHIVIHLKETKKIIKYFQAQIKSNPTRGFWLVSFIAFLVSPFLTNDGVCLLLVEPILFAFQEVSDLIEPNTIEEGKQQQSSGKQELEKMDIIYFLLALACSTNIGSTLTYTGNPQNMIVASDSISIMPSYKFLLYMILPALVTWILTISCVEWCWKSAKEKKHSSTLYGVTQQTLDEEKNPIVLSPKLRIVIPVTNKEITLCDCFESSDTSPVKSSTKTPLSPRRKRAREREKLVKKVVKVVSSPIPYCTLSIVALMIVLIFVNVMPIAGLICLVAIVMVLFIVLGNRWKDSMVWEEESNHSRASVNHVHRFRRQTRSRTHSRIHSSASIEIHHLQQQNQNKQQEDKEREEHQSDSLALSHNDLVVLENQQVHHNYSPLPITYEDKIDNLNEFFEDLFGSIDYSLLLIFLGTFIVVENMASTGIPRAIFKGLVGPVPFSTLSSIVGISLFVLIASQLLGNVAVVQLAKPNVHDLTEEEKRFAWALISFISTIGGNLTIAGSAANIIVAEKANRMDSTINFDFFRHFRVCFGVTLLCCVVSGALLSVIVMLDNKFGSKW